MPVARKSIRKPRRKLTSRMAAVRAQLVPKARNAFALYLQEQAKKHTGKRTRAERLAAMKETAKRWKSLPPSERDHYKQLAFAETQAQRVKLLTVGVPVRGATAPPCDASASGVPSSSSVNVSIPGYYMREYLAKGSYGVVMDAASSHGQRVAVKLFKHRDDDSIHHELHIYHQIMQAVKGESERRLFVHVLQSGVDASPFPFLAFAFAGPDLDRILASVEHGMQKHVWSVAAQLQHALQVLHNANIVHLDVKPKNIMWNHVSEALTLGDYGLTHEMGKPLQYDSYTTPGFRPPELWQTPVASRFVKPSVDLWGWACIVLQLADPNNKIFFRPLDRKMQWQRPVLCWAKHWSKLGQQRRPSERDNDLSNLEARLRGVPSTVWDLIHGVLHPNPEARRWPQSIDSLKVL